MAQWVKDLVLPQPHLGFDPMAWELPYAMGVPKRKQGEKKKGKPMRIIFRGQCSRAAKIIDSGLKSWLYCPPAV